MSQLAYINGNGTPHSLRIGVIGCGYWGVNYVRVFSEIPGAEVVAVCDHRPDRLDEVAHRYPTVLRVRDLEELLAAGVDAVVVSTEACTHHALASRAILAGKHALVEKPITTTVAEAQALTELAEAQRKVLMVGHTFLYNAGIAKVKECLLREPQPIYYLHACRTNLGPVRRDVNALWDLATHDIAIFNHLLDAFPLWVSAVGSKVLRNRREDVGFISLGYPGEVIGHIHVSWADPNKARQVVVVCSNRRIVFDDVNTLEQVRIYDRGIRLESEPSTYGEYQLHIRDGDIHSPRVPVTEPLKEQCRHFLECIQQGRAPLSGGRQGTDVLRVLEAVDRSVAQGGAKVEIARQEVSHVVPSAA